MRKDNENRRFSSTRHLDKLVDWVDRIYYANIAMNNEAIKAVIDEIAKDGHVTECPPDND